MNSLDELAEYLAKPERLFNDGHAGEIEIRYCDDNPKNFDILIDGDSWWFHVPITAEERLELARLTAQKVAEYNE